MSDDRSTVIKLGEAGLTGWRGAAARRMAKPVADRTQFSQEQVEAIFGLILLALAIYWLGRPVISALRK
jgi:Asp/Glu/hydantoin racemase